MLLGILKMYIVWYKSSILAHIYTNHVYILILLTSICKLVIIERSIGNYLHSEEKKAGKLTEDIAQ